MSWGGVVDELEFARRLKTWIDHGFKDLGDSAGVVTSDTISKVRKHDEEFNCKVIFFCFLSLFCLNLFLMCINFFPPGLFSFFVYR